MKSVLKFLLLAASIFMFQSAASAADKGSASEETALVKKAAAYLKANGQDTP